MVWTTKLSSMDKNTPESHQHTNFAKMKPGPLFSALMDWKLLNTIYFNSQPFSFLLTPRFHLSCKSECTWIQSRSSSLSLWLVFSSVKLLQSVDCVYTLLNQDNNEVCIKSQKANIMGREFLVSNLTLRQIFIRIWVDTELSLDFFLSFPLQNLPSAKKNSVQKLHTKDSDKHSESTAWFLLVKAISYPWSRSQGTYAAESFFSATCNLDYDSKEWYLLWYQRRQAGKNALIDHMAKKYPGDILMSQHYRLLEFDNENAAARHW